MADGAAYATQGGSVDNPPQKGSIWRRLTEWLFPTRTPDDYEPFPDVHLNALIEELEIDAVARRHGQLEKPTADSARVAGFEPAIDDKITQRLNATRTRVGQRLASLDNEIQTVNTEKGNAVLDALEERLDADCRTVLGDGRPQILSAAAEHAAVLAEHRRFRDTHGLERPAHYPPSRLWCYAVLLLVVLLETIMNGYFFAAGSDLGLLGGAMEAFVISVINVMVAYLIGHHVMRWWFHRAVPLRVIGVLVTGVYLVFLIAFLGFITLYRDAFAVDPDAAAAKAFAAFRERDWRLSDVDSILFLVLSVVFAVVAVLDAFAMDDRYPGYGRMDRFRVRSEEALMATRDAHVDALERACRGRREELQEERQLLDDKSALLQTCRTVHARISEGYAPYLAHLETCHKALIARFRAENTAARTTPAPTYFNEPVPELALDRAVPALQALRDIDPIRERITELQHRAAQLDIDLTERYNETVRELDRALEGQSP